MVSRIRLLELVKSPTKYVLLMGLLLFAYTCFLSGQTVSAITKPKGLTLSPLRTELNIAPGTSQSGTLKVTNYTNKQMLVNLTAETFSVIDQQYDYAFTAESNVAKWVDFNDSQIVIPPGKSQVITYNVNVPLSAEPGGRYISMFASTDTGASTSGVESRQRVASLFYINILGDVSRIGKLVSLTSPWIISGDSAWSAALQNSGTTHYRSRYSLQIKDLFSNGTVSKMSGEALILPGSVRLVTGKLSAPSWPGLYKTEYNIGLGDNPAAVKSGLIIYMPIWAAIVIIILLIAGLYWLWEKDYFNKLLNRKHKK